MDARTGPPVPPDDLPLRSKTSTVHIPRTKLLRGTEPRSALYGADLLFKTYLFLLSEVCGFVTPSAVIFSQLMAKFHIPQIVCNKASIHTHRSASTAVTAKTAAPSVPATPCSETPATALTSTWRWPTHVIVSISRNQFALFCGRYSVIHMGKLL